jgi:hypothetical protein
MSPDNYRRKKAAVLDRWLVKGLGDGMWQDAATPHLYLSVKGGGRHRSYIFRYKKKATGKDQHLGLGSANAVDLERARQTARSYNELLASGEDPEDVRDAIQRKTESGKSLQVTA